MSNVTEKQLKMITKRSSDVEFDDVQSIIIVVLRDVIRERLGATAPLPSPPIFDM